MNYLLFVDAPDDDELLAEIDAFPVLDEDFDETHPAELLPIPYWSLS